jgi:CheY-like chemotaxis protein
MVQQRIRPHVLIENADRVAAATQAEALELAGFQATHCQGPGHEPRKCPVLSGGRCSLIEDADVVIHDLDLHDPVDREVLRQLQSSHPGLPIVVEATTEAARLATGDLDRCTVVVPYSMEHLVSAVTDALAHA